MLNKRTLFEGSNLPIFISDFFSSPIWILGMFLLLLTGIALIEQIPVLKAILMGTTFWLPISLYFLGKHPDLEKINQRLGYLEVVVLGALAAAIANELLGPFLLLRQALVSTVFVTAFTFLTTPFWKISVHTEFNTLIGFWVVVSWGKFLLIPFSVIIFLIAYSRLSLRKHDPAQVLTGIITSLIICGLVRKYF